MHTAVGTQNAKRVAGFHAEVQSLVMVIIAWNTYQSITKRIAMSIIQFIIRIAIKKNRLSLLRRFF